MQIKNEKYWGERVETLGEKHPVVLFAQEWAERMEKEIADGRKLDDIAEKTKWQTAEEVDVTGIESSVVLATLVAVWIYGEQLRKWWNIFSQLSDEGKTANNIPGAVLSACSLSIN